MNHKQIGKHITQCVGHVMYHIYTVSMACASKYTCNSMSFQSKSVEVNLLNYNGNNQTNEFLNSLAFNSFICLILQTTRITNHSYR